MNLRRIAHERFLSEFQNFLTATAPPGSVLGVRDIRPWVWALDPAHPLLAAYGAYWESAGGTPIREWTQSERNRILGHLRFLPGFYREVVSHRRVGTGTDTRYVRKHANRIKII